MVESGDTWYMIIEVILYEKGLLELMSAFDP